MPHPCHRCGNLRFDSDPGGLCPRCLMGFALDADTEISDSFASGGPGSVLETLTYSVGPMPRVLLRDTRNETVESPVVRPWSAEMPLNSNRSCRIQLLGEIARGGMGAIFKGRDPDLGRDLAVKILLESHCNKPELVRRFVEEAQIGGQLQHPGIVPVYELGTIGDSRPYFTMKLVKGDTLAKLLEARKSQADDLFRFLGIFEAIAQTVAYAHARDVIHRDLKPSNVMVGSFGEVQVMDWGLAKVLPRGGVADDSSAGLVAKQDTVISTGRSGSDDPDLSLAGSILGTPSYMAPEQARGEIDRVDERADVFSLGSFLCEILTGQPAFLGRSSGEIQRKAALGDLADAMTRLDACGADVDLVALTKDCLAREPEDRPREAGVVSDRVTAYLAGVQEKLKTAERERSVAQVRAQEARKQSRLLGGLAAAVLALTTLGGLSAYLQPQMSLRRSVAPSSSVVHQAAREWELAKVVEAPMDLEKRALVDASRLEKMEIIPKALEEKARVEVALAEVERQRTVLVAAKSAVNHGAVEAPGQMVLPNFGPDLSRFVTASDDGTARVWDATTGVEILALKGHTKPVKSASFSPDGKRIITASPDGTARVWDAQTGAEVLTFGGLTKQLRSAWFSLDGSQIVAAGEDNTVRLWDAKSGAELDDLVMAKLGVANQSYNHANFLLSSPPGRSPAPVSRYQTSEKVNQALSSHENTLAILKAKLGPDHPETLVSMNYLAHAYESAGQPNRAVPLYEQTLAIQKAKLGPDHPSTLSVMNSLGRALIAQGRLAEAVYVSYEAIRLKPDQAEAHYNLGNALQLQAKLPRAVEAFRRAIQIKPDYAEAHYSLGEALRDQGKLDLAVESFREAIRLKPDLAGAHAGLDKVLRMQTMTERLPALLIGEDRPKDVSERLALAQMCHDKKFHAAAARFWAEAFAESRALADDLAKGHRYNAACSASLAGSGQGTDEPMPNEAGRIKLREQALSWLRDDLAAWAKVLEGINEPARKQVILRTLAHWKEDADLAGIRDPGPLSTLPEGEQTAWRSFWQEVDALISKAGAAKPN
jgi:eukaryotic-like serine/threonine-protein kinase